MGGGVGWWWVGVGWGGMGAAIRWCRGGGGSMGEMVVGWGRYPAVSLVASLNRRLQAGIPMGCGCGGGRCPAVSLVASLNRRPATGRHPYGMRVCVCALSGGVARGLAQPPATGWHPYGMRVWGRALSGGVARGLAQPPATGRHPYGMLGGPQMRCCGMRGGWSMEGGWVRRMHRCFIIWSLRRRVGSRR